MVHRHGIAQTSLAVLLCMVLSLCGHCCAEPLVTPPATVEEALARAFASAGVVFAGTVVNIRHETAAVTVCWQVDEAVRGVSTGSTYELKEWPGLWAGGERYSVGERALVLLHAPSALGYSSPVNGQDGVMPLRGDAGAGGFDLRWIAAEVAADMRVRGDAGFREALTHLPQQGAAPEGVPSNQTAATPQVEAAASAREDVSAVDRQLVLGLLHAWEAVRENAR
jgi:hypothetical protein